MSKMWIVYGDRTTGGGVMVTAAPETDINGLMVCRLNDRATCPLHKGVFPIVAGCDFTTIVDGQPVALHGATVACGCKVIAGSQAQVFVDNGGSKDATSESAVAQADNAANSIANAEEFDDRFKLELEDGTPAAGYRYELMRADGSIVEGTTDTDGMISLQQSDHAEEVRIRILGKDESDGGQDD